MFTERFAIQQRMSEIKEERRALNDEFYRLLDRLHGLDEKANANDTVAVASSLTSLSEELSKAIQSIAQLVPSVPVAQVIENIIQENAEVVENTKAAAEEKPTETQQRVAKEVKQARVAIEASESTKKQIKPMAAMPIVLNILKEEGVPLSPTKIAEKLDAKGYETKTAIHEIVRRLKLDGKIESPSFGYWQPARQLAN